MLTLLHIVESLVDYGGAPRELLNLNRCLDAAKCRQVFLCYLPSPLKGEFERQGAVVECLDSASPAAIVRAAVRLARVQRADAVCTHFTRPLLTGYLAARLTGLPVIHREHCSPDYQRGAARIVSRLLLPRVQSIVCNSHYTLGSVRRAYGPSGDRLVAIHCPVQKRDCAKPRRETREELGLSDDALLIGHVGGMIPQRDQGTLITAFARLKREHPGARLVLIGDGRTRGDLESLAARHRLGSSVVFTGYTDRIGDYLAATDIYVNPTLDEGFGIAVVEAMLAGLPVVLSDQGAHPELIRDGVSGLLYRAGDSDALADALGRLARDAALRVCMGELARLRGEEFRPERFAEIYFENALKVAASHRRSATAAG